MNLPECEELLRIAEAEIHELRLEQHSDYLRAAQAEAALAVMTQAVGLATTIKGDMEIDVRNPIGMMQQVCTYVDGITVKVRREALEGVRIAIRSDRIAHEEGLWEAGYNAGLRAAEDIVRLALTPPRKETP